MSSISAYWNGENGGSKILNRCVLTSAISMTVAVIAITILFCQIPLFQEFANLFPRAQFWSAYAATAVVAIGIPAAIFFATLCRNNKEPSRI